jgi:hypothetical protein
VDHCAKRARKCSDSFTNCNQFTGNGGGDDHNSSSKDFTTATITIVIKFIIIIIGSVKRSLGKSRK